MSIKIDVAAGELIDKITILEIKLARIKDPAKLANVRYELDLLLATLAEAQNGGPALDSLRQELRKINEVIWDVEDDIRDHERRKDFGPSFVELARAVYHNNDQRARLKRQVNELLDSKVIEEKSYTEYR